MADETPEKKPSVLCTIHTILAGLRGRINAAETTANDKFADFERRLTEVEKLAGIR